MEKPTETNRRSAIRMTSFTTREETREDGGSDPVIEGYFAVFGDVYELWPGASETIQRGAFSGVVGGDVRALINHDTTLVLGRTRAGTLTLYEDERGLFGRIRINPDDSDAMSLYARVKRGDVDTIATDHCPFQQSEKDWGKDDFRKIPNGCADGVLP